MLQWRLDFILGSRILDPEFIRDLFARFRPVTLRRMFSGAAIGAEGITFGLVFRGAIYLKVDEASIPDFEQEGSRPFSYTRSKGPRAGKPVTMSYWRLPERLYDDPEELARWAERAYEIARRGKQALARKSPRRAPRKQRDAAPRRSRARS